MIKCLELTFKLFNPQDKKLCNILRLTLAANGGRAQTYVTFAVEGHYLINHIHKEQSKGFVPSSPTKLRQPRASPLTSLFQLLWQDKIKILTYHGQKKTKPNSLTSKTRSCASWEVIYSLCSRTSPRDSSRSFRKAPMFCKSVQP